MESLSTILLQRKKQLFAFNKTVNVVIDDTKSFSLGNGEFVEFELETKQHFIKASSCLGEGEILLNLNEEEIKKIEVSFQMSKREKLIRFTFIIASLILTILSIVYSKYSSSIFILLPILFIITRNKNKLSIKKV